MNDTIKFTTIKELYKYLLPALKTKRSEMAINGFVYVMPEDIFNYIKQTKWKNLKSVLPYEMVGDILDCDPYEIDNYIKIKIQKTKRELVKEETLL